MPFPVFRYIHYSYWRAETEDVKLMLSLDYMLPLNDSSDHISSAFLKSENMLSSS